MKKAKLVIGISSIMLMMLSVPAFAQTNYYVATAAQGGNDANTGTSLAAPFATIAKAITKAIVPGDSILVRSGTYVVTTTVSINKPGTAVKHIVLTVYKPDMVNANSRPLFDFSSMAAASSNRGFSLSGANYWDIYGIVIKGAGDNGMVVNNSSYTTITFCSFTRNRDSGLQLGSSSHHVSIINCDSYENADLGTGTTTLGGNADGFAPKLDVGDSILFRGCRAWLNSDDGWDGYLRTNGLPDNMTTLLEDCWVFRNGYYWLDGSTTSDMNGNGFKLGGSDTKDLAHNFVLTKCLSFYNKANGYDQNSNAGSIYLYNCSAYQNTGRDYFMTSGTVTYRAGAELVLKNNMSLGTKGVSIPSASTASRSLTTATNSFSTATSNAEILSLDTTGVTGMRSVDGSLPTLNFMHLNTSASTPFTYIDKGTVLSNVLYHGTIGVPYNNTAPDLGAFESSNGSLPIKLLSFTAFSTNNNVQLNWKTVGKLNGDGWNTERTNAASNASWMSIGFVNKQTSLSNNSYSFLDKNLVAGSYYYRLEQPTVDGHSNYSNVLLVKLDKSNGAKEITAFPNPFMNGTTLRYDIPNLSSVFIRVYNEQGQLVDSIDEGKLERGIYHRLYDAKHLQDGKYYLKLFVDNETTTIALLKHNNGL
jgi:hypothetical protein